MGCLFSRRQIYFWAWHISKSLVSREREVRGDGKKKSENPQKKKKKVPVIFLYFGLPVNVSVSLDVCLSAGFFTQTGRKMERFQSAASGYKPRLDPFGFPCWLSEMSKIQDWICLKHNAVKPQSRFFCCFFSSWSLKRWRTWRSGSAGSAGHSSVWTWRTGRLPKGVRKPKPS